MIIQSSNRIADVKQYYFARKLGEIAVLQKAGKEILNCAIGSPDLAPPPAALAVLEKASREKTANKYQSYKGLPELRNAFADWYRRKFSVELDGETEVLPLIGSKEGIMHISMSFLNAGDEVLVPNPGYPAYATATKLAGGTVKNYDLTEANSWFPDIEALANQDLSKVKLMWLNYPNMPTGATASKADFEALVKFAQEQKILLCHDNPYAFILNDSPQSILNVEGAKAVALELNSLSKCFNMAGWRVGAVCGAADYLGEILKFKSNMDSGMYLPVQKAAVAALESPASWYDDLNKMYLDRREKVWEIMDQLKCTYDRKSKGLFVWGKLPVDQNDSEKFVDTMLDETGVFITPGFIFGSNGAPYVRIALCSELAVFDKALNLIKEWKAKV